MFINCYDIIEKTATAIYNADKTTLFKGIWDIIQSTTRILVLHPNAGLIKTTDGSIQTRPLLRDLQTPAIISSMNYLPGWARTGCIIILLCLGLQPKQALTCPVKCVPSWAPKTRYMTPPNR